MRCWRGGRWRGMRWWRRRRRRRRGSWRRCTRAARLRRPTSRRAARRLAPSRWGRGRWRPLALTGPGPLLRCQRRRKSWSWMVSADGHALPLPMSLMLQKHRERGRTIWKESGWRPEEDNSGQDPRSAAIRRAAAEVAKLTRKAEQVMSKKDVVSQTAAANAQRVWSERMTGCFPDGGWAAKPGGHPHDLPAMPAVGRVTCESEG
jgi:hypothetical protein